MWAGPIGVWRARLAALAALAGALVATPSAVGASAGSDSPEILVRLRADGVHAVTDCLAARERRGQPLASATRDGSDSLDRLHDALGVRDVRPLFRRADARPLAAQRAAERARLGAVLARRGLSSKALPAPPDLFHVYRLRLAPGVDASLAAERYRADPHVLWAQPNLSAELDLVTDDPFLSTSGSWGQSFADLWGLHRIEAPAAWDVSQGDGVVVAVVDTGVDWAHPDLAANVWVNPGEDLDGDGRVGEAERNGIDDDANGFVDDFHGFDFANSLDADGDGAYDGPEDVSDADPFDDAGHGTHVAGIVASVANNGIGVAGVAPRARIMALKGFPESGGTTFAVLVQGMLYAILNGADVINNSWSCGARCPSNPIVEDAVALANAMGVVVVTSAGNARDDVQFYSPENRRGTLTAGASEPSDRPSDFTNDGLLMDVLAPGSGPVFGVSRVSLRGILSLLSSGASEGASGDGAFVVGGDYLRWSGTSMSSPALAGVVALVRSLRPDLTPEQVRGVIRASALDLDAAGPDANTGRGMLSALGAVTREPPRAGGAWLSPDPATVLRPQRGPVPIRGRLFGDVARVELSYGLGRDPQTYEPIPLLAPARPFEGELALWDVPSLPDGPYVLRLEVFASFGERVVEFLPLSLERPIARRLSSDGPPALRPVIAGDLVVWQSQRPEGEGEEAQQAGFDLFARDWRRGEEWRVVGEVGDQRDPTLSGKRLAWRGDGEDHAIRSCRVVRRGAPCQARTAIAGPDVFPSFSLSTPWTVWTDRLAGPERMRGCVWVGSSCWPVPLPQSPDRQSTPVVSGERLYWSQWQGFPPRLFTCVGPGSARCQPALVKVQDDFPPILFAADGDLLAWAGASLFVCRVEADGTCREIAVPSLASVGPRTLAVSGHRVVWSAPGPGGDDDVLLCEFDDATRTCPIQRLASSAASQSNPAIDGDRVVWEDDGVGRVSVHGIELPSLEPVEDRGTLVGRTLRLRVRGRDPEGGSLVLSAAFADGTPLSDRGARFQDGGDGRGLLVWRPDASDAGSHVVRFAGAAANGLVARRSARIEIEPAELPAGRAVPTWRSGRPAAPR